ncbi:MAG TPA: DNA polymerase III subunit delta [Humibacter sp.]|nr:DNA polymerase III subunit delta [Humibacter sp.]
MAARKPSGTAAKASIPQLQWHEVRPAPIVLITGPESLLAERAARMLRDAMKQQDPSVEVSDLRAGEYAPGSLATLASPSLFGEPRLIRVDGVEKSTDGFIADALDYVAAPADGAVLLLRHAGGVRGKKLLDAIRGGAGGGIEITCAELKKDADKYDFARAEFGRAGKKITPGALRSLTQAFTDDLAELAAACTQLIADASAEISEQVVDRYYSGRVETNAFRVADAAIAGQYGEALVTLRHALSSGADPVPIVAAFASKVRTMARLYGARGSSAQLAGQFGLAPWQVDRARRDLQGWTDAGLARSIEVLAQTDAAVKGAGRDPVFALETMISVISSRGTRLR